MAVRNNGRTIQFVTGIQGVSAGGQAQINFSVNQRYHRIVWQIAAIAYGLDGVTPTVSFAPAPATQPGGTPATFTATVSKGVITGVAIATAGSGQTPGTYNLVFTDANGVGATATAVVAAGGTVTATPAVTSGGTVGPCDASLALTSSKISVNGINIRDITPAQAIAIARFNGCPSNKGNYPVYFTEPWRNLLGAPAANSWDLFGASTFQFIIGISANITSPSLTGIQEFDFQRNAAPAPDGKGGTTLVPFAQPVSQHAYNLPVNGNASGAVNSINTLPFGFPIGRLYIVGGTRGAITQLEIYQDSNKILEATTEQLKAAYEDYGFALGPINYTFEGSVTNDFDVAYVSDVDQRWYEALNCLNQFIVRLYSTATMNVTFIMETLPGSFVA